MLAYLSFGGITGEVGLLVPQPLVYLWL